MKNFWDDHMGSVEVASVYMEGYGEGVGSDTRRTIGAFINDGETLLDVGCGPGWNYAHFKKFGPIVSRYKGIDYSRYMIKGAKKKYPGAEFAMGDCRHLDEQNDSWDVVLLQDVLEHTNGYERPVREALRVARKRVVITFWHLGGNEGREHINDDGNDGWGAWYDKERWELYLDKLGYHWMADDSREGANRKHWFYIIEKERHD